MLDVQITSKLRNFELDINFSVGRELAVLFGPSGSGKTTILKAIAGIYKPDKGRIRLNHQLFFENPSLFIPPQKRKVGFVFQEYALFPHMTVYDNIYYGLKKSRKQELTDHVEQLLQGLSVSHLLQQFPRQLSGGEKQRVALVRSLAQKPDVLLLDEPFAALDHVTKLNSHTVLEQIKIDWKIPIILVTHDQQEAEKLGDRMIHLLNGHQIFKEK